MTTRWEDVIHGAIEKSLDGVHTSIPAKVTSYLPALQQCAVEPVIEGMPPLEDVPVLWPRGGGHFVHLPLTTGDWVLLTFCESDVSPWRLSGSAQAPALLRRHGLYAFATPGAAPDVAPLVTPVTLTGAAIGVDGGMVVQVTSTGVQIGPAGIGAIAVTNDALLHSLLASACAAAIAAGVPNDGGKAAFGAFQSAMAGATASTVLKVVS